MPKLKPPENFGVRTPEVCALCRWFEVAPNGEYWFCYRGMNRLRDFGALGWKHFKRGCDLWVEKLADL